MTDRIGVLGEATATTVTTTTVYTCPASKAAKGKIMFRAQGDLNSVIAFLVNGLEVARVAAMTVNNYVFSIGGAGLRVAEQAAAPTGIGAGLTVAPSDQIYYLNAGDTVQYTVVTAALLAMNCQFVGTEIDVA